MPIPSAQAEVVAFLSHLSGSPPLETAGSLIFWGSDDVLKLRKAIARPMVDARARRRRRELALYELETTARTAPDLHHELLAIVRRPDGSMALAGDPPPAEGQVVDWALRLSRVDESDFAAAMPGTADLDGRPLDLIGDAIADLHKLKPATPGSAPEASGSEIARLLTLATIRAALEAGFPQSEVLGWASDALMQLDDVAPLLDRRTSSGRAVAGHGNLHLGNLCLWRHEWALLDPIPPDPAVGLPDAAWDLASLVIELEARDMRPAANRLLSRYVARTGDSGLVTVLPLFMSVRAMLRAAELAAREAEAAAALLRLSGRCLGRARGVVVAVGGMPGVGKTTLARALAPELGVSPGGLLLRSDEVRKRLLGLAPEARSEGAGQDPATTDLIYGQLAGQVRDAAVGGHSVVVEGLFLITAHRDAVREAAKSAGAPFVGLWLDAPLPAITERLAARAYDVSESTVDSLRVANQSDPGALEWLRVDATDADEALQTARAAIDAVARGLPVATAARAV